MTNEKGDLFMTKEELMMSKDIIEIVNFKNKNKDSNLSYKKRYVL